VHAIVEGLYRRYKSQGMSAEDAFINSAESITGRITKEISTRGIKAVYTDMSADDKKIFEKAYSASYSPSKEILQECYDEVKCGNEIRSVIMQNERVMSGKGQVGKIDGTETWQVGERVRAARVDDKIPLNPFTAGVYVATMMAQIDVLLEGGHSFSEVINESVIEAVDSLAPYMHYKGVAFMVDNCSFTAKWGSRKWAPRFDYNLEQQAYAAVDGGAALDEDVVAAFLQHPVHDALAVCTTMRPSVDISVTVSDTSQVAPALR